MDQELINKIPNIITYSVEDIKDDGMATIRFSCVGCLDLVLHFYLPVREDEFTIREEIERHCPVASFVTQVQSKHPDVKLAVKKCIGLTGYIPMTTEILDPIASSITRGFADPVKSQESEII